MLVASNSSVGGEVTPELAVSNSSAGDLKFC